MWVWLFAILQKPGRTTRPLLACSYDTTLADGHDCITRRRRISIGTKVCFVCFSLYVSNAYACVRRNHMTDKTTTAVPAPPMGPPTLEAASKPEFAEPLPPHVLPSTTTTTTTTRKRKSTDITDVDADTDTDTDPDADDAKTNPTTTVGGTITELPPNTIYNGKICKESITFDEGPTTTIYVYDTSNVSKARQFRDAYHPETKLEWRECFGCLCISDNKTGTWKLLNRDNFAKSADTATGCIGKCYDCRNEDQLRRRKNKKKNNKTSTSTTKEKKPRGRPPKLNNANKEKEMSSKRRKVSKETQPAVDPKPTSNTAVVMVDDDVEFKIDLNSIANPLEEALKQHALLMEANRKALERSELRRKDGAKLAKLMADRAAAEDLIKKNEQLRKQTDQIRCDTILAEKQNFQMFEQLSAWNKK